MKILYTHRTQGVGAEGVHVMGMVEAFRELGHSVELDGIPGCDPFVKAAAPQGAAGDRAAPGLRARLHHRISHYAPQWAFALIEIAYNLPILLRLLPKLLRARPDFVYERYALNTFAPALLCRMLRIPHVLEVNDSVAIVRSRPLAFPRLSRALEEPILRSATVLITISGRFRKQMLDAYPRLGGDILVCPNAVSSAWFRPRPPAALPHGRDLPALKGRTVLGSAGQFVPWHGLAPFVTAMADLAVAKDLAFLFVGDGPVRADVEAAARARGIADRVVFTGMVPYALVPDYMGLLDIAVIPFSNVHGSPMKLMEFMAKGLPVVAPDLPPIREVMEDRKTGRVFPADDMAAMRTCLEELLADPAEARALGERAKEHVREHLTWLGHAKEVLGKLPPS